MKNLTLSMISLAMILIVATTVYSVTTDKPAPTNSPGITYVVSVDASNADGLCHSYYVTISDNNGNIVGTPKLYHDGITNYVFHEAGPVYSPRVANLEKMENSDHHVCNQTIYTIPDVLNHRFFSNNTTYQFELYPTMVPGDD